MRMRTRPSGKKKLHAAFAIGVLFASGTQAQTIDGSLADALNIDANSAAAVFSGSAGTGIPLPSAALGLAPGEPVLILNTDLNIVAVAGGAIEDATGGVVPSGSAQSVIRAGISGGDVVATITNEAADIVATAVEQQSGGFVPASAARSVIATAVNGGDVGDALEAAVFGLIVDEAARLLAGQVGQAVQSATAGFIDPNTLERLFNGAVRGQNLEAVFSDAFRRRIGSLGQIPNGGAGGNNPVVIVNVAAQSTP